jgi:hypothetical protein
MKLNHDNYYTPKADLEYMSNSQYKAWLDCPARQAAIMRGEWTEAEKLVFLVGKYVDQSLLTPDTLPALIDANRDEIMTKKGELRADFTLAEKMIARAKRDDLFMGALDGEHQRVVTWEMFGIQWRAMFDACDPERGTLTDLKTCRDFEPQWDDKTRTKLPFYERFGYWTQLAIYREGYKATFGHYPEYVTLACVTKQAYPRIKVIVFEQDVGNSCDRFAHELEKIEANLPRIIEMRTAAVAGLPYDFPRCESCDYCADSGECKIERAESLVW